MPQPDDDDPEPRLDDERNQGRKKKKITLLRKELVKKTHGCSNGRKEKSNCWPDDGESQNSQQKWAPTKPGLNCQNIKGKQTDREDEGIPRDRTFHHREKVS